MTAGNQAFQKQANLALVLRSIREQGMVSRVELSRLLGLKKSTVTNITGELLELGLVEERMEGQASSQGGRRPVYLGIAPGTSGILGLELELGFFRASYLDLTGTVLFEHSEHVPVPGFEELYHETIRTLTPRIEATGVPLAGIGIALPGSVDLKRGMILHSVPFGLNSYPFAERISDASPVPVLCENDTNCGAWGELWRRNHEKINMVYLVTRFHYHSSARGPNPGAGLGLVIDGQVYYGSSYNAGEFASNHWDRPGTEYLGLSSGELAMVKENPRLMKRFFSALFRKISISLSILDPHRVILGGDSERYKAIIPEVLEELRDDSWFGDESRSQRLRFAEAGETELSFGAAAMVLENLYRIPRLGPREERVGIDWSGIIQSRAAAAGNRVPGTGVGV